MLSPPSSRGRSRRSRNTLRSHSLPALLSFRGRRIGSQWRAHDHTDRAISLGNPAVCHHLRSRRHRLVGRPDQLVRIGRALIPVEQKPKARRLQQSPILQIAAQCLLVQEVYGIRPPYGIVVLAGGCRHEVEFSPALELRLLDTITRMRSMLSATAPPEPVTRRWAKS